MKESGTQLGIQGTIAILGTNGIGGMAIFGVQKFLVQLDPVLKFWLFWAGLAVVALATTFAVFRLMYSEKVHWMVVGGVAALGIMVMILMSPIMPAFFPYNPVQLSMSNELEAGGGLAFPSLAVALGAVAFIIGGVFAFKDKNE